jgi:hypothetical protein
MDKNTEDILIEYVTEQFLDKKKDAINVIHKFCLQQSPITKTVYRGHNDTDTIEPGLWYSSSENINVAGNDFSGEKCCVFKIHLLDIPTIDINQLIGNKIRTYNEEKEFIFLGGGTFYKNEELTEEGFLRLSKKYKKKVMFECWYKLNPPSLQIPIKQPIKKTPTSVNDVLDIISPDEYDLIDSKEDIILPKDFKISNELLEKVFEEIRKRKNTGGKKRKTQKRKNTKGKKKKNTKKKY